jgi:hypothetical protein
LPPVLEVDVAGLEVAFQKELTSSQKFSTKIIVDENSQQLKQNSEATTTVKYRAKGALTQG